MPQCSYEVAPFGSYTSNSNKNNLSVKEATKLRFQVFLSQLQSLLDLTKYTSKNNNGFVYQESKKESDIPQNIIKGCANLDCEMLEAQFGDWYDNIHIQHQFCHDNHQSLKQIANTIKNTEIEISVSKASQNTLQLFQQRLTLIREDRLQRFRVLQEMMDEISFREFDFRLELSLPSEDLVLELPQLDSALGIFGELLLREGEKLPLG